MATRASSTGAPNSTSGFEVEVLLTVPTAEFMAASRRDLSPRARPFRTIGSGCYQGESFLHYQRQHVAGFCAERHADADFTAALRHRVRGYAGQSDGRENDAEQADQSVGPGSDLQAEP